MATKQARYDEDFKKSLVALCANGKTQTAVCQEYGVSPSALTKWIKQYSTVETEDGDVLTAKQIHQEFNQKAPNLVWASDFSYIKLNGKWYYPCIVMDLFSRKIIGWHIASKHNVELTMNAFKKAYKNRNVKYGLIFHSDQGSEYTAFSFQQLLDSLNVVQSFSKKGYPFDNACCESFFKFLKRNLSNRKIYHSRNNSVHNRVHFFDYTAISKA